MLAVGGAVIGLALAACFLLSLAEASLLAITDIAVRRLVEKGNRRALVVQQLKSGEDYLSAIIVGINASVILISTLMTVLVHKNLSEAAPWHIEAWHIGAIVFILVFAEVTPKTWGALAPEKTALAVAPAIHYLIVLTGPLVRMFTAISNLFLRLTGTPPAHQRHFISAQEIKAAADIGEEEGMVEPDEGEMFDSVIELGETAVREIMAPRVDIVAVSQDATAEEVVAVAVESGHSRIPVYEGAIDSISGILYVNDLLRQFRAGQRELDLAALARPAVFVPETKRVSDLFRELRDQRVHIAVVLDEFGGTEGLVTIEDILEELVGEIEDEHDPAVEEVLVLSETEALVDGKTRITDVNEHLSLELPEDGYETIGGLVAGEMGHIPQVGERLRSGDTVIIVEQGTEQHVERVRIVRDDAEGSEV